MPSEGEPVTCSSPSVNQLLGGGLRRGAICLLEEMHGESSGVPAMVGLFFLLEGLRRGEGAIILLSEHTVAEYRRLPGVRRLLEEAKPGQLIFMDALTSMCFGEPMGKLEEGVVRCSNVCYAEKFYEEFRRTVSSLPRPRMFIDSLSVLMHAMESDRAAWRFWLSLLPFIRHRGLTMVALFYPEMHSPQFVESMERISDAIIRFTASPSEPGKKVVRYVQVVRNRGFVFDDQIYPYVLEQFNLRIFKEWREGGETGMTG